MSVYKLVNAEQLDRAVQATADAIKTKGETTEKIPWNKDTGFKDAVLAIQNGGEKPQLIVTAPAGSTITAVNEEETVTGVVGAEGTLTLDLPAFGTWTVTATLNGQGASASVYIEQEYPVSLSYITTFTVNGGHGETITISDNEENIGSVTLDSAGTGTVTLTGCSGKTLVFTGGLSGYERTVDVGFASEMTVNVYPDKAIYWYGREFADITGGWTARATPLYSNLSSATPSVAKGTNAIYVNVSYNGTGSGVSGAVRTVNAVKLDTPGTLVFDYYNNGGIDCLVGLTVNAASSPSYATAGAVGHTAIELSKRSDLAIDFSSELTEAFYIFINVCAYSSGTAKIGISKIYLE